MAILVGVSSFGGVIVMVFVFMPATLISIALCYPVAEWCKDLYKKYVFVMPLVFALLDLVVYALLINVIFRVIIVIV